MPIELDRLVAAVTELTDGPATLVDDLSFSNRAAVARVVLACRTTAVAKMPFDSEALTNEVQALRTLPADTRPGLIASGNGVVVMEDLGRGPSLADLLLGDDRDVAEEALYAWAGTLGRALAATIRDGAPAEAVDLSKGVEALVGLGDDLGVGVPAGVEADVATIAERMSATSPWLAYCPGDTCPDNNRVLDDGTVRLFDFEGSGWRHAATEAAYCRAPFCTCWCVASLPADVLTSMEAQFLTGLRPQRVDDFSADVGLASVWWTIRTIDYFRRFVLTGRPIGPPGLAPSSGRQYVVRRLTAVAAEREEVPALAQFAGELWKVIVGRWPSSAAPATYPAFR